MEDRVASYVTHYPTTTPIFRQHPGRLDRAYLEFLDEFLAFFFGKIWDKSSIMVHNMGQRAKIWDKSQNMGRPIKYGTSGMTVCARKAKLLEI